MIKTYRKKPEDIEAALVTQADAEAIARWCGGQFNKVTASPQSIDDAWEVSIDIPTLLGVAVARPGDYVVKILTTGRFYVWNKAQLEEEYQEFQKPSMINLHPGVPNARSIGGSGEAYGDYPDYRFQVPDPSVARSDTVQAKGWGKHSDSP